MEPKGSLVIPQDPPLKTHQYSTEGPGVQLNPGAVHRKPVRLYETWIGVYTVKDCNPIQETFIKN